MVPIGPAILFPGSLCAYNGSGKQADMLDIIKDRITWLALIAGLVLSSVFSIRVEASSQSAAIQVIYLPLGLKSAAPDSDRYFSTLPPGSTLPGDAECAAAVKPRAENKGDNLPFNSQPGNQGVAEDFFTPGSGDPRANTEIGVRVDGAFTGTTDEILQWAACKWGIDEDLVRAQAAIESWWHQDAMGDWGSDASRCPPGHGLGVDGEPGLCPESWGLLQTRYPYEQSAWPGMADSSAFNADTAYAIWRACFEGYEWWLNDVERGEQYGAGDAWGCIGRWFAGRWHTQPAEEYILRVQDYLSERIWEQPDFQEP